MSRQFLKIHGKLPALRTLPRATGVSRALRARETPKKVWKKVSGASGRGTPKSLEKVSKKSEKSGKSLENVCLGLLRDFLQTFWDPGAGGPGRHFSDFFGISGPEGPRDSCSSREGSQSQHFDQVKWNIKILEIWASTLIRWATKAPEIPAFWSGWSQKPQHFDQTSCKKSKKFKHFDRVRRTTTWFAKSPRKFKLLIRWGT